MVISVFFIFTFASKKAKNSFHKVNCVLHACRNYFCAIIFYCIARFLYCVSSPVHRFLNLQDPTTKIVNYCLQYTFSNITKISPLLSPGPSIGFFTRNSKQRAKERLGCSPKTLLLFS